MAAASPSSVSPSPGPSTGPANRHAPTALEKQRMQLEKLLKDPAKPAYVPAPPKDKSIRPAREMMKNVQGSSAGAGSGEFHVYKASRRREYERLKLMDEKIQKEASEKEFEEKKRQWEAEADAKTSKNRAKRQKKKEKAKAKGGAANGDLTQKSDTGAPGSTSDGAPLKKRRLINGKEVVFRRPGEEEDSSENEEEQAGPIPSEAALEHVISGDTDGDGQPRLAIDTPKITIHEDD